MLCTSPLFQGGESGYGEGVVKKGFVKQTLNVIYCPVKPTLMGSAQSDDALAAFLNLAVALPWRDQRLASTSPSLRIDPLFQT